MLTVKFIKYAPVGTEGPAQIETIVVHPAKAVFVDCQDVHGRAVVGLEDPNGSGVERFTIGQADRSDVMFNVAYVMNDAGRTVETIR